MKDSMATSRTKELITAMAAATERKTYRQWANMYGVSESTVRHVAWVSKSLRRAIISASEIRRLQVTTHHGSARIGKLMLDDAGLLGLPLQAAVSPGRIVIEAIKSKT